MPKIRTHKGTQKRFRLSGTGKLLRRGAFQSHMLEHKSAKRKRGYAAMHEVVSGDAKSVRRNAPYLKG
ncbi:MAG TPA: 50S ribosomal protein L35 [Candidatus Dormibacteraeota bacterium]|nr:50S ribosomal protein L35 [Candidatus Dormibacteraeota bacterium]